jgi:ABC-type transport system substrate-binding protein/DNA-binding SARP family transcriptional activator/streptogramin lyase
VALIDYRLLGPTEVGVDGDALDIGGPKQRALLVILLLSANLPVSRDVLVDRLWGEHPPSGAQHTLEVYVSRLRKTLEPAATGPVVLARPGTYVLRAAEERIDVRRFERLAAQGRRALADGAPDRAAADLREALALWRGAPLSDVSQEQFAQGEIARLEEMRAGVIEDRIDADLALGRHADLVGELQALVAAHPLRERLYQQLMIALYRCGRQAEALAVYRSARRTLVQDLGIEPSLGRRRVERAILEHDVALEPPARAVRPQATASADGRRPGWAAGTRRARLLVAAGVSLAIVLVLLVSSSSRRPGGPPLVTPGPDSVGVIDAAQGAVTGVVSGAGRPAGLAYGAGAAWITDSSDDLLLRVNSAHQVVDRIPVGRGPAGVTVADNEVWVVNEFDGTVTEVSPAAGTVVGTIKVGNGPEAIASGYGSVWVANLTDYTLSRIDEASGVVVATVPLGSAPAGLAAGNHGIWVTSAETGRLLFVDPRTNRVLRAFSVGVSPGSVAFGAGRVWVADSAGTVARVDPATGRVRTILAGGSPAGIVYADGAVWVAGSHAGSVARIDPQTGSVRLIHVGNDPTALAAAGPSVLATVLPSLASHRGGTLTVFSQLASGINPGDPATAWDPTAWQVFSITNDGLVAFRHVGGPAGSTVVPDLATALPVPADNGTTYTFRLRPGIRYSSGALVRPADFRHALERVFKINQGGGPASFFYSGLLGAGQCEQSPRNCSLSRAIVADDKANTVTFHLAAPDPEFLYQLALPFADAVPAGTPDHQVGPAQLPATGPYMTQSLILGHNWILVRNPRFRQWASQAQPGGYPDRIVVRFGVGPEQEVKAVEQGRGDVVLSPPAGQVHELATHYASQLRTGPLVATFAMFLNTRVWPFSNLAARQAINYAVDRNKMIGLIGGSLAGQPTCQILPPTLTGYRPYCPYTINPGPSGAWTAPDMAKAEQLVHASGTAGAKVTVLAGGWDPGNPVQAAGLHFVSILDQLGYRASLQVILDPQVYVQRAFDSRAQAQIGEFSWFQDFPAPSDFIVPLFTCHSFAPHSPANLNVSEFCNRHIDAEVAQARQLGAKHPNAAGTLWTQIDRDIVDQAPWVPLYNPNVLVLLSRRVGNFQLHPLWSLLLDQMWVR